MPNGLFEVPAVLLMRSVAVTADVRPLIGVAAAVLAAILAAYASWHVTDRIMSWWQRADQDEL
ncbi:hypothetical protein GCM10027176_22510 [Actinoallomurus bryophytorum]|uniref:Uncharacterized protein n=1 Tax=Actinoallomurus bryophytorum TaxID=1490222 RepID=A0A543CWK1_9ACTN|nr:hypothetical protein [Actinoallomurus bryophytorum]TQM01419.1 hypothetical protein FB559_7178 [Actinoallomurus bryophytorum]